MIEYYSDRKLILDVIPLHNNFKPESFKNMTNKNIKEYYGENIAFYFEFLYYL